MYEIRDLLLSFTNQNRRHAAKVPKRSAQQRPVWRATWSRRRTMINTLLCRE